MKMDHKLKTELFPNNTPYNNVTLGHSLECAVLCHKYLYCTTFSYNDATNECRFVVGMNTTSNATVLMVYQQMCIALCLLFILFRPTPDPTHMKLCEVRFKSK
jgi:hypothetical protein